MTEKELAYYFDHTFLKAFATRSDFEKLCAEAKELSQTSLKHQPALEPLEQYWKM